MKKYRFELQKAVNTPVCGISAQSGEHLADKIKRLKQLLSGENVGVVGGMVSAREHPEAKIYCLNFLAKKLVVSSVYSGWYNILIFDILCKC